MNDGKKIIDVLKKACESKFFVDKQTFNQRHDLDRKYHPSRMAWAGDKLLATCIAPALLEVFPIMNAGDLSALFEKMSSNVAMNRYARRFGVLDYFSWCSTERQVGEAFEQLIGLAYTLEGDYFVDLLLDEMYDYVLAEAVVDKLKMLQEQQGRFPGLPEGAPQ